MRKLTKQYKVIYREGKLAVPLTKDGYSNEVDTAGIMFPDKGTEYAEFDTYEEADTYVKQHNLVYVKK